MKSDQNLLNPGALGGTTWGIYGFQKTGAPMALTRVAIKNAKLKEKAYKLSDEKGLLLFITPTGGKYWRLKYRFGGKEKKLALGVYPEVSLAEAREKRDKARKMISENIDPGVVKQASRRATLLASENSFQAVALEWYGKFSTKWVASHGDRTLLLRINVSGFIAYIVANLVNSYILTRWKVLLKGRKFWLRSLFSSTFSEALYSFIAILMMEINSIPLSDVLKVVVISYLIKATYSLIFAVPANVLVNHVKNITGIDVYDFPEKFTPFKYLNLRKG